MLCKTLTKAGKSCQKSFKIGTFCQSGCILSDSTTGKLKKNLQKYPCNYHIISIRYISGWSCCKRFQPKEDEEIKMEVESESKDEEAEMNNGIDNKSFATDKVWVA